MSTSLNHSIAWSRTLAGHDRSDEDPPQELRVERWNEGQTFGWYRRQSLAGKPLGIRHLELRKDYGEPLRHEYILAHLQSGVVYCLERRADPDALTNIILPSGTDASDSIYNASRDPAMLTHLEQTSECMIRLSFSPELDTLVLLLICHGIQSDDQGQTYTLQRFNCYFFARTVIAALARYASMDPWDAASHPNDPMRMTIVPSMSKEREDDTYLPKPLLKHLFKRDLSLLRTSLLERLWKELFDNHLVLDVRMALRQTLWRSNAEFTVNNAVLDAVRAANNHRGLARLRESWIEECRRERPTRSKHLAAAWDAAWRDMWRIIRAEADRRFPTGADWNSIWDSACDVPNLHDGGGAPPRRHYVRIYVHEEEISELKLQEHILKMMKSHGEKVNARALGISSSVYWQVQLATNRAWKTLVMINPTFDINVLRRAFSD